MGGPTSLARTWGLGSTRPEDRWRGGARPGGPPRRFPVPVGTERRLIGHGRWVHGVAARVLPGLGQETLPGPGPAGHRGGALRDRARVRGGGRATDGTFLTLRNPTHETGRPAHPARRAPPGERRATPHDH